VEIPGGRGVIKDPLERKFLRGEGGANQKPSVGGVWISSGTTHCLKILSALSPGLYSLFD